MRIFCFFIEPASYTLDLAENIYKKKNIDYCFLKSTSLAFSSLVQDNVCLDQFSLFYKIKFIYSKFQKNNFIIINGYNNYCFILIYLFNFFVSKKRVIAIESDTQLLIPKNLIIRFFKWLYLSIIFRNKFVLGFAGGNSSHKELFRYFGMHEDRIFLMPMMVNNSKFYNLKKIFPNKFTFLFVGRLVKYKNVENLIKQFNRHFFDKRAVLKIVGDGEYGDYLKCKYNSSRILFLGKLFEQDLIHEFENSSCFVLPSYFEPWGLVVNEAMSASLPVISNIAVGANFDLINGKDTGMIASDINEFGDMMLELYNDSDLLFRFSNNASDLMKNYWNYDLYDKCLNEAVEKVKKWI